MSPAAAVLAIIPPAFAFLVERFNPVSTRAITKSAEKDLAQFLTADQQAHQALISHSVSMVEGAVEVAGLAPTFVACVTSGFGVFSEFPNPWMIVVYILVFLAILLFLLNYLSGETYLEMAISTKAVPLPWVGDRYPVKVVRKTIYLANGLLIAFVLIIFAASERGQFLDEYGYLVGKHVVFEAD